MRTNVARRTPKHNERFKKVSVSNIIQTRLILSPNLDIGGGASFALASPAVSIWVHVAKEGNSIWRKALGSS
jgi:hypothetical protein